VAIAVAPRSGRFLWYIAGLLFLSTVVNYLDRQTLSVLAPRLKAEFRWSNADFALIIIAFRAAYAIGQAGAGGLLDRLGTRLGLTILRYRTSRMVFKNEADAATLGTLASESPAVAVR
jgi:sugar phosphate permease